MNMEPEKSNEHEDGVCDLCGEEKPVKVVSSGAYHKVWACDSCMDEGY